MTARLVVVVGMALVVAGVYVGAGLALALIAAGAQAVVFGLLFVNVDGGNDSGEESAP